MTVTAMLTSFALLLLSRCVGLEIPAAQTPRAAMVEAREMAYNANARNDTDGMKRALAAFERVSADDPSSALAAYYASWTAWSLAGSHFQARDMDAAKAAIAAAVGHARRGLALRPGDAEFQTMAANAMIGQAVIDSARFQALVPEIAAARKKALELGPRNPRAVMMEAGMIFNIPPERGGSQEKGIARFIEALAFFDEEAAAPAADDLEPRWGRDLAHGWLAGMYLRLTPPALDKARAEVDKALFLRPDFWFVREVLVPQLTHAR